MSQITFKKVGLDNVNILQNLAIETFRQTFSHDNSEEQLQAFFNESYTLPVLKSEITHAESDTKLKKILIKHLKFKGFIF